MAKTYSSKQFTYNKETDTFVAEASELRFFDGQAFYIKSAKTGRTRMFLITERQFTEDADQEFVAWKGFCPAGGHRVVVFND
jgi:hypothetical protein